MSERERLIKAYLAGRYAVTELAKAFGISRKTVYKWLPRFAEFGLAGLAGLPRAARRHPNATPAQVVAGVIERKQAHPTWGPLKLLPNPDDPPELIAAWPAASTRGAILARAGLTRPRRGRRRAPPSSWPFAACDRPNAVWCADFKGWFRTEDGQRCNPLTVSDAYSRMLLCCQGLSRPDYKHARPILESSANTACLTPSGLTTALLSPR